MCGQFISSGAGFNNDRVEPELEYLRRVSWIPLLGVSGERVIAIAQKEKNLDPNIGCLPHISYEEILPIAVKTM